MNEEARPVDRMSELPPETREFLAQLRKEDIDTLKEGVKLVNAIGTVGTFAKWLIAGVLGLFVGMVMFAEAVQKIMAWFRPS